MDRLGVFWKRVVEENPDDVCVTRAPSVRKSAEVSSAQAAKKSL
jgi:hypothetical protein